MSTFQYNRVGCGYYYPHPTIDFETYSEAGYYFDGKKPCKLIKGQKSGLAIVGTEVYASHPSADIISLQWNMQDGSGTLLWIPGTPLPHVLFEYVSKNGIIEAHNSMFEFYIWNLIGVKRYGFPRLSLRQLRCSMAKAYAYGLPGSLKGATSAIGCNVLKDSAGDRLIRKLSIPQKPWKRIRPVDSPSEFLRFYDYGLTDVDSEMDLSSRMPDLSNYETEVFLHTQEVNDRGVHIDRQALEDCIWLVDTVTAELTEELQDITNGEITSHSQSKLIPEWLKKQGVDIPNIKKDTVTEYLKKLPESHARRVLEIRQLLGSESVKKIYAIYYRLSEDNRIRGLFQYYGANRTGRYAGRGPQPHNSPSGGPDSRNGVKIAWTPETAEIGISDIATRDIAHIKRMWRDPLKLVSGLIRALYTAGPGKEFIGSDFSAIEAVVTAELAEEPWRQEVFRTHGKIYEQSAANATGIPFQEILRHKQETGEHHPARKKIGKVRELAGGFGGAVGAWCRFGADKFMTEQEIIADVKKWRKESPNIVKFWYDIKDAAVNAVMNPGNYYKVKSITYGCDGNVLYCQLPSGRLLCYQKPQVHRDGRDYILSMKRKNTDNKKGPIGWVRMNTWHGELVENVVQATARDILVNSMFNLERAGYPVVLHVHDEIICEVPKGFGSIEEFERIGSIMPRWAADWPVKLAGGWRGLRFRKD